MALQACNRSVLHYTVRLFLLLLFLASALAPAQTTAEPPAPGQGCLLYRHPVSGMYAEVPLQRTNVALDVRGLVVSATVTQQFSNTSATPIEAVYIFPLPHNAAVYEMEMRIGERVIRSVIKEREEAKRIYEAAKTAGQRAALVEEERPNIFTTSVANVMPGDRIDVRLSYVEPLRWENGRMRLVFPMVVGPRYVPGNSPVGHAGTGWSKDTDAVPDASRITPFIRNPESRSGHDITLTAEVDPGFKAASVKSISHPIDVLDLPDGRVRVELAEGATIPNRDFVLEVLPQESRLPTTSLFLSPTDSSGESHFLLAAFPPTVSPGPRRPMEMQYVIDVSGSMEGTSIIQAREALLNALDRLVPSDRFSILAFNHEYREFAAQPLSATSENLDAARRFVRNLGAGGGTEMLPALLHLMRTPSTPGYLRHIVLLTDGDLGNEEQIFAALRRDLGDARLFTVAIGSAPNHFLATKMAQFGRGTFTHIADNKETVARMSDLFDSIESPVLTDVKLSFEGVPPAEVYPQRLPDLFQRQPLLIYGRIAKGRTGKLVLTARAGNEPYRKTIDFDASQARFHAGITTLWARQRVEDLMDDWRQADESGQKELRSLVVAHALRYHLVTRFTSLVAVEEIVANAGGPPRQVPVPTELPAGWKLSGVAGAPATGTADDFLEALGMLLVTAGGVIFLAGRNRTRSFA